MIIGVGTDICETARVARAMRSGRFASKVFTAGELAYCAGKPPETAAGLFAAKEAAVKALGVGFRGFWPCDVEILRDGLGRPFVKPHGEFGKICESLRAGFYISVSHTRGLAIACAVAEANG